MTDIANEIEPDVLGDELSPEQVLGELGDEPDESGPIEPAPTEQTEAETPTEGTIRIGEREYQPSELAELVSKGEDYTRKTMALADERKNLEADAQTARELRQALKDPVKLREFRDYIDSIAGGSQPASSPSPSVGLPPNWEEWTDNERELYQENQHVKAQLAQLGSTLKEVREHLAGQTQRDQRSLAAREAAEALSTEWNVQVTADQVLEAMIATKLDDPEAAWLKANKASIQNAMARPAPAAKKPNTPGTRGKTFDASHMSADEIRSRMSRGEIPTGV